MRKLVFAAAASAAALALPAAAHAQAYAGVSAGYHDLDAGDDVEDEFPDLDIDSGSPIIGGFVGYDVLAGGGFFVGAEANFHIGTDAIDSEYGVSGRIGFADQGGAKYYVRGGYQEVELDLENVFGVEDGFFDDFDVDDSGGDFLLGAGADFPMGESTFLRVNVDTVGFDSARATAGFGFRF